MFVVPRRSRHRRAPVAALGVALAGAVALTACSSPASGTTSSNAAAVAPAIKSQDTQYSASQKFNFAGKPIDVSSVKGDTVWWIPQDSGNPFLSTVGGYMKQALSSVGVKVTECNGKSNPVDANNCISQGTAQHVAAIQIDGPEPSTVANSAQGAVTAGIPVLAGAGVDAADPTPSFIAGITSQPYVLSGQLAADWAISDSGGRAHVLVLTTPDVVGSVVQQKAFQAQISKYCSNCKVTTQGVTLGNWANDLGPTTSAALTKDPSINYVFPVFDPMTQFTNPAIQQAGKASTVKVVTVNGNLPFMQQLATGTSSTKAIVGLDLEALGYIEADQILRVLTKNPTVKDDYPPARLFTVDSAKKLDLSATGAGNGSWYGGVDSTKNLFASLWKQ
jgi:ribose transport system substrate-binding protein